MGRVKRFNLRKLINLTKADTFFETGTWKGDGLAYAARFNFDRLYSSEIMPEIAAKAVDRFKQDKRVSIIQEASVDALKKTVPAIKGNCIFWLDAHFPGAEEGLKDYNAYQEEAVKLPLQKELECIATRKGKHADVILIDDLRIYELNIYESGNMPGNILPPEIRNTDFVNELFGDSHHIYKSVRDEGYIYMIPKNISSIGILKRIAYSLENKVFKKIY